MRVRGPRRRVRAPRRRARARRARARAARRGRGRRVPAGHRAPCSCSRRSAIPLALAGAVTSGVLLVRSVRRVPRWRRRSPGWPWSRVAVVPIGGIALFASPPARRRTRPRAPRPAAGQDGRGGRRPPSLRRRRPRSRARQHPALLLHRVRGARRPCTSAPASSAQAQQLGWPVSDDPGGDWRARRREVLIDEGGTTDDGRVRRLRQDRARVRRRCTCVELEVVLPYR